MQRLLDCADGLRLRDMFPQARLFGGGCPVPQLLLRRGICRPGDVYVAVVDADGDGHDDVDLAVQRGAVAVVTERLVPVRVPCCIVPDSREAYGRMCQRLAGQPDRALRLVGVTGSHGKTTTSILTASVLQAAHQTVGATCSLGYSDGESTGTAEAATPPPQRTGPLAESQMTKTAVRTVSWRSPVTPWLLDNCRAFLWMRPS